jgi:HSP20 family protein
MTVSNRKTWCPAIEVKETTTHLILKAEIPGLTAKDLNIQVSREVVSITGEHPKSENQEEKELFPSELHYGQLQCDFPLPVAISHDRAKAELIDGILTVTMPKSEPRSSRDRFEFNLSL